MECDTCGKNAEDNFQAADPFDKEINPDDEHPIYWWCKSCYKFMEDCI